MKNHLVAAMLIALSSAAHADPASVAGAIIADELPKCANGIGNPGGCVGPNGEGRKIVERNIVGPVKDVLTGDIGRSDKSVWRQLGLPRIKIW